MGTQYSDRSQRTPIPAVMNEKRLHDQLLEQMPEGASHPKETCAFCAASDATTGKPEGGTHMKTYSEEELQAALDERTAELTARIEQFESASRQNEIEAAVEAVKAESAAEVADLREQLDSAVLKAQAAEARYDETVTYLTEVAETAALEAEIASRRDGRLAQVREAVNMPEEYLESRADVLAAMSDEDFEAKVAEWAALAPKSTAGSLSGDSIPSKTALTASRETTTTHNSGKALVRDMFNDILTGSDPRSL